jgi:hypothetical protein
MILQSVTVIPGFRREPPLKICLRTGSAYLVGRLKVLLLNNSSLVNMTKGLEKSGLFLNSFDAFIL